MNDKIFIVVAAGALAWLGKEILSSGDTSRKTSDLFSTDLSHVWRDSWRDHTD